MEPKEIKCECLNGVYNEIANLLGVEAAVILHSAFRGQQINFPVSLFTAEFMRTQVTKEYNGHNIKYLATKYGYSEKWIRKMINGIKK
ncbi:MAG TPA: Mor transcription activator family protein [Candidatus Fimenecus excrementigallinarum]|uniref:Mor transcription activator family protein n=1 Tax=Candidatus Fimenecus excrementigallinarum TaxID=2840816 RepID=A0A9D1IIH8_9FIRM|nr:Mor transcription activator family protein [Candidatus Fimenecus excrementigallinarum]